MALERTGDTLIMATAGWTAAPGVIELAHQKGPAEHLDLP